MSEPRHINPDGTPKYTNRLAGSSSPYLLQHAHNPVDWWPWGPAAFAEATRRDVPILLSIGYATCYWCHVMERQCFEDEAIAAQMNEHFLCIKLDREQRPDVDEIYMTATQLMTGAGGWPMNCFLTPPGAADSTGQPTTQGLEPFFCGTYFPPEAMQGRPSWPQVLEGLSNAWTTQRLEVLRQAASITDAVREHLERGGDEPAGPQPLTDQPIKDAVEHLNRTFDRQHGGFGGAPKFPTPTQLELLWSARQNEADRDAEAPDPLEFTLDKMALGGLFDQVGGGFHRYSTDAQWLVPHFEKMLYDNAQLLGLYARAAIATTDADRARRYRRVAAETAAYVIREMTDATGAFWSAQDAEVNGMEGQNYVWTAEQVRAAVGDAPFDAGLEATPPAPIDFTLQLYGLSLGTNFQDPHHAEAPAVNVLFMPRGLEDLVPEPEDIPQATSWRDEINRRLKIVRDQRDQPSTDDKVIASWNGMMITGLADAGRLLGAPDWIAAAARAAEAVRTHLVCGDGSLMRTMRDGTVEGQGQLEDYAWLASGLLALHRARATLPASAAGAADWIDQAQALIDHALTHFDATALRGGGCFDTLADQPDLIVRTRSTYDGATPSANAVMLHALMNLAELANAPAYAERAVADLRAWMPRIDREGIAMTTMVVAMKRGLQFPGASDLSEGNAEPSAPVLQARLESLADDPGRYDLHLIIAEGMHLNAHEPGVEGLVGLEVTASDGLELRVTYPEGEPLESGFNAEAVNVYEGLVTLRIITVDVATEVAGARLQVRYQACTESTCLAPATLFVPLR